MSVALPYQPLSLPPDTPKNLEALVRLQAEPMLAAVHAMLRLPREEMLGLEADCTLSAALTLLGVVSGVSVELLSAPDLGERDDSGKRFKLVLEKFYPWETERNLSGSIIGKHAACLLYDAFRNPLAHRLGTYEGPYLGDIKVLKGPLDDQIIEEIERSAQLERELEVSQPMHCHGPTLYTDGETKAERTKTTLSLKRFYWGVRLVILRALADRTPQSAKFAAADGRLARCEPNAYIVRTSADRTPIMPGPTTGNPGSTQSDED